MESFGEFLPVPDRVLAGSEPDQVLVLATLTTVGRESGAEFTMPVGHLLTIRDGKVARFQVFTDPDEALSARRGSTVTWVVASTGGGGRHAR